MKKVISLLIVAFILASLTGCGSSSESTASTQTAIKTEAETPNYNDPSWALSEAADPVITEKVANPEDDPRMIVQVHFAPGRYAFIDQYNLIGYSKKDDEGASGADYYLDENAAYIPEASTYIPYFTPATGVKGPKIADGKALIDLENWARSFDIDIFEMGEDDDVIFYVETNNGKKLSIRRDYYWYTVPVEGSRAIKWSFDNGDFDNHGEPLYESAFGKRRQISNNFETLWIIEQGLKALENDYAGNPW